MTSTTPSSSTLVKNARVFDGKHDTVATGVSVLIEGDKITTR